MHSNETGGLLLSGGVVLHPDGDLDDPRVEDIFIRDGRIAALGEEAGRHARDAGVRKMDAAGKLVVPGFINAHYHSHDVLLRGSFEGLPLDVWALYASPQHYARRSNREIHLRTLAGAAECLLSGITAVQDMVTVVGPDREHCDAIVDAYQASGLRVALGLQISDRAPADAAYGWRTQLPPALLEPLTVAPDLRATQALVESLLRQAPRAGIDWVLAPSAPQRCSEALLSWAAAQSRETGAQVFTHVYEAKIQALQAREQYGRDGGSYITLLERLGLLGPKLTIAHGVWISDPEIRAMGAAGANISVNPTSNLKLRNGVAPIRGYLAHGVGVAVGCDNCSGNDAQNIFESMKLFALFLGLQSPAGGTHAARKAYMAATLGGARALGRQDSLGAIRPGFQADLVLLDLDDPAFTPRNQLVNQLVYAATPRAVHTTIVGGRVVVENGRLVDRDLSALAREAGQAAAALRADFDGVVRKNHALAQCCLQISAQSEDVPFELDQFHLLGKVGRPQP